MQQRLPSSLIASIFARLDDIDQMYYLTASLIPEWLEYMMNLYNTNRRVVGSSWKDMNITHGQSGLYMNGHYHYLRQEIRRRGPLLGLFAHIQPNLKDPFHRSLHQFVLEQCEIHYTRNVLISNKNDRAEAVDALRDVVQDGGEVDIIKLHCMLPLYTKGMVQDLIWSAIPNQRLDVIRYLRTVENYYPNASSIIYAIRKHEYEIAILLRGCTYSFRQGHFRFRPYSYSWSLCEEPSTCDCLGGWPTLAQWKTWENEYLP